MDIEKLKLILENHKHWLNKDCDGWEKMKADLFEANLINADLHKADLRAADLRFSDLHNADLRGATLRNADLSEANLSRADLYGADLRGADLRYADLRRADLNAAILCDTDLRGAELNYANLFRADLDGAKGPLIEYRRGKILSENIIGYKKCKNNVIVTLEIPKGAIVFSINGERCRTNKAKVISIDGAYKGISRYKFMSYYVGDEFVINNFSCEYNVECGRGIHFFMTREEAKSFD